MTVPKSQHHNQCLEVPWMNHPSPPRTTYSTSQCSQRIALLLPFHWIQVSILLFRAFRCDEGPLHVWPGGGTWSPNSPDRLSQVCSGSTNQRLAHSVLLFKYQERLPRPMTVHYLITVAPAICVEDSLHNAFLHFHYQSFYILRPHFCAWQCSQMAYGGQGVHHVLTV
jgi:hypothetical protein